MADKEPQTLNIVGGVIGVGVLALLYFVTYALVFRAIPEANQTTFSTLLGIISSSASLVIGFFFGSSQSSKKNSDTISTMAKTQASLLPDPEEHK